MSDTETARLLMDLQIKTAKEKLRALLEQQRQFEEDALPKGCKCHMMIFDYSISRLDNFYCPVHHPEGE